VKADLDEARIAGELAARGIRLGHPLSLVEVTESTNDDAKRAARGGVESGAAFIADAQTGGRGRLGRTWHSPPGENLYASFVVRPALDARTAPLITLAAGLAVVDAVTVVAGPSDLSLKWPNDVLLGGRKLAGILCEAQLGESSAGEVDSTAIRISPWIVIGIGINVHSRAFPGALADRATSLALAGASSVDRAALFVELCSALARRIEMLSSSGGAAIVADVGARDALLGREVLVDGVSVLALGIAPNGGLRVRRQDGVEMTCLAGEVRLPEPFA
jgi:BirA family biotin operon repressor/biotin-[acetyl-CoA-carboxylase] ligase